MTKPEVDPEAYLKNWVSLDAKDYLDFLKAHWGTDQLASILKPDKPLVERFLSITQTDVLDLIKAYPSDTSFFLRKEYALFIDRLTNAWTEKGKTRMHGCLLLGQPAIGKTCFLLFFLIHCLSRQETVLFTTSSGRTFLFHSQGVSTIKTSDFTACLHLPPRDYNAGPFWSLVDCPDKKEPIASSVTYGTRRLFFVVAVSPDESRYKLMAECPTIRSYWMSRWSAEELVALWTSIRPTNIAPEQTTRYKLSPGREFDLSTVNSLISDVGPCPQDILSHLRSPDNHRESVDRAIGHYTSDIFSIDHLLSHPDALSNQHSHKIVLVSRVGGTAGQDTLEVDVDDRFIVRFKTLDIFKMLHTHLLSIEVDATRALFMICKGLGPGSGTIFASFLFEGLAILFTRGLIPLNSDHPAFHPLILMDPVDPPPPPPQKAKPPRAQKAKTTYRFVYTVQASNMISSRNCHN
ncbi:hypothetical protein LXA43DRAFT_232697 [Ganoderma leucocontextum]|nr:hypothetical protein LXA43DRAFT_232697 [Ganoderma leucocontextum]